MRHSYGIMPYYFNIEELTFEEFRALAKVSQEVRSKRYMVDQYPGPGVAASKCDMQWWEELVVVMVLGFTVPGCVISVPLLLTVVGWLFGNMRLVWGIGGLVITTLCFVPAPFREEALSSWLCYLILKYFSFKAVMDEVRVNNRPAIKVAPPHGVFPYGNLLTMAAYPSLYGFSFKGLAASAAVTIPIFKHCLSTIGVISASSESATKALEKGLTIGISTGGVSEVFETNASENEEVIVLKGRKGLIKLAMKTGSELLPCYLFGNTQLFSLYSGGPLHSSLRTLSRKIGFALILFWGRFGLPIPYREPIFGVMGKAIPVVKNPNPADEEVNALHKRLCDDMVQLFDKHKASYGWEHKKLVIE